MQITPRVLKRDAAFKCKSQLAFSSEMQFFNAKRGFYSRSRERLRANSALHKRKQGGEHLLDEGQGDKEKLKTSHERDALCDTALAKLGHDVP